jgi:hypothetical protein
MVSLAAACSTEDSGDGGNEPSLCELPFDAGPCEALIPVYASVNGSCVPRTYGGCEGNDNRFSSLEECMATCEGRPPALCLDGRTRATICIACGPAGGCGEMLEVCAEACSEDSDCSSLGFGCWEGVCQATYCE